MTRPLFRNHQPPATTADDIVRRLAALDIRMLTLDMPDGWHMTEKLRALHHDAVQVLGHLDTEKETKR